MVYFAEDISDQLHLSCEKFFSSLKLGDMGDVHGQFYSCVGDGLEGYFASLA